MLFQIMCRRFRHEFILSLKYYIYVEHVSASFLFSFIICHDKLIKPYKFIIQEYASMNHYGFSWKFVELSYGTYFIKGHELDIRFT